MSQNEYYLKKAKYAYELYCLKKPFRKVYAVIKKDDRFVVLQNIKGRYKFSLAGGGIDEGEDEVTAIKRELIEELNMHVNIIKSLGKTTYFKTWNYNGKDFDVEYQAEIFLTEFIKYDDNKNFGLEGEFDDNFTISEISKQKMLSSVFEFVKGGILLQ